MSNISNRELSWIAFNRRVLQEASDQSVPLLQRLRFLGIYSNNQDEFYKVRIAKLMRLTQDKQLKKQIFDEGYTAPQLLDAVNCQLLEAQAEYIKIYSQIMKEMQEHGIFVINEKMLNKEQEHFCQEYFIATISRQIVPLFLHKTIAMPFLPDNKAYLAVKMEGTHSNQKRFAVLHIPISSSCPRFVQLPSPFGRTDLIFQDDIIRLCLDSIFFMFNYESIQAFTFKIVRDSILTLDDDISTSLREKMETELENRLKGKPVRMIYDKSMPSDLLSLLSNKLKLSSAELEAGSRYHMMRDLMTFPRVNPALEEPSTKPIPHPRIKPHSSILKVVAKEDILLSFPYHSFDYIIDFLREAAIDPKVTNIFITLYRTAEQSKIVNALVRAAQNGKKVTATVELLARFDEERNVETIDILQAAGIQVIHGSKTLKVHSKLILIERKEHNGHIKRYMYVGTGNFNEKTAKLYSDMGLLTANPALTKDARSIFDFLANMHKHFSCSHLIASPYYLRKSIMSMIKNEIKHAKNGNKASIWIKCNSLTDRQIIALLYKASQEGVEVRLIVRGICCIKSHEAKLSENIRAISIVDMYLEHARIMIFNNNGENRVYLSSADLMPRNLDRRLEVAAPIIDKKIQKEVKQFFTIQWMDTVKARRLDEANLNHYSPCEDGPCIRAQTVLYDYYKTLCAGTNA